MTTTTELVTNGLNVPAVVPTLEAVPFDPNEVYRNPTIFDQMMKAAEFLSKSKLIPAHFQDKPADCFIAMQYAGRLRLDAPMVMQNMCVVHGKPGMEAKLAIAIINASRMFEGPLDWELQGQGMTREAICYGILRGNGKRVEASCNMEIAKAEGWLGKNGSKWQTMPDVMLCYRSAMFLARRYCPQLLMGLQTVDELEDIAPHAEEASKEDTQSLTDAIKAPTPAKQPEIQPEAPQEFTEGEFVPPAGEPMPKDYADMTKEEMEAAYQEWPKAQKERFVAFKKEAIANGADKSEVARIAFLKTVNS